MFSISSKSDGRTEKALAKMASGDIFSELDHFGRQGVEALARATPIETGLTANSWQYRIIKSKNRPTIEWYNTNVVSGTPVVILIQYGHGTGTGGYVQGRDFINPAMRPIFDQIAADVWEKVVKS